MIARSHGTSGALLALAIAISGGCAPLSQRYESLDGTSTGTLATAAVLEVDQTRPVLLVGLDGKLLPTVRFQSTFRSWSFVLAPGRHVLWLANVPYGYPFPQRRRCYALEATFEAGARYRLQAPPGEAPILSLHDRVEPLSSGRLLDNPWAFERDCRW